MIAAWWVSVAAAGVSVGVPLEYDLVGTNIGVRPEVIWYPGERGIHGLRFAVGVLPSRENLFVPVSAGWRARTGPQVDGHALFGFGMEAQSFFFTDRPPFLRPVYYVEFGGSYSVSESTDLGLMVVPELDPYGVPGIGLGLRAAVWF